MIIHRYIIVEILKPAAAIITVLLAVFISYSAATYLADAVAGALPPGTVGLLIGLRIGMALEVLLPTTLYLSIIIAIGRLYRDFEMTALASCGISYWGIIKPVLLLAIPVAIIASGSSLYMRPEAYKHIYRLKAKAKNAFEIAHLEPDQFFEIESEKYTFFAEEIDTKRKSAHKVFLRAKQGNTLQLIRAEEMTQNYHQAADYPIIVFRKGAMVELPFSGEGKGEITYFEKARYPIISASSLKQRYRRKAATTAHLLRSKLLEDKAELQWRLSTPINTILLALLAMPLSRINPRKGKYSKIGVAISIFAIFYQLYVVAKTQVENGSVNPVIGIWWVPILIMALVIFLIWRSGEISFRR